MIVRTKISRLHTANMEEYRNSFPDSASSKGNMKEFKISDQHLGPLRSHIVVVTGTFARGISCVEIDVDSSKAAHLALD